MSSHTLGGEPTPSQGPIHPSDSRPWTLTSCLLTPRRYGWPEKHLEYMLVRATDHGSRGLATIIRLFKWARNNVERPGCTFVCASSSTSHEVIRRLTLSVV